MITPSIYTTQEQKNTNLDKITFYDKIKLKWENRLVNIIENFWNALRVCNNNLNLLINKITSFVASFFSKKDIQPILVEPKILPQQEEIAPFIELEKQTNKEKTSVERPHLAEPNSITGVTPIATMCSLTEAANVETNPVKSIGLIEKNLISNNSSTVVKEITKILASKNEEELKKYLSPEFLTKCSDFKNTCRTHITKISFSGQNSINCKFLTSEWNKPLHDPAFILGLFALKVLSLKNSVYKKEYIERCTYLSEDKNSIEFDVCEIIKYGLETHPVILECMPLNERNYKTYLKDYKKQKEIGNTFIPLVNSLHQAYFQLENKKFLIDNFTHPHGLDKYDPAEWKTYHREFEKLVQTLGKISIETLLKNRSNITPAALKNEILYSFTDLMYRIQYSPYNVKDFEKMALPAMIENFLKTDCSLYPDFRHEFYDPLHLLAGLKQNVKLIENNEEITYINFINQIFKFFYSDKLKEADEIQRENISIAQEQFYIKLRILQEKVALMIKE